MPIVKASPAVLDLQPKALIRLLHPKAKLPLRSTEQAAGFDLHALCLDREGRPSKVMVPTRCVRAISTGLALKPPDAHVGLICSRSGLARSSCVFVANSPGVIDPDYTGEILILLFNGGYEPFYVEHEQRIAQVLFLSSPSVGFQLVESLPPTQRGESGFGSTGR